MTFRNMSFSDFTDALASSDPTPGGGGAAACTAALSSALGSMVCRLTAGKEKYAEFNEKAGKLLSAFEEKRQELLSLCDEDAKAFLLLSQAYKIPKDDEKRDMLIEEALSPAAIVPLKIMRLCGELVELFSSLYGSSTPFAVSDIAAGVSLAAAAMEAASVNVYANTQSMRNDFYAGLMEREADELREVYRPTADALFQKIENDMRKRRYDE